MSFLVLTSSLKNSKMYSACFFVSVQILVLFELR